VTRDDIVAMAQEAIITHSNDNPCDFRLTTVEQLEHFAQLVAQVEREACACIAETAEPYQSADLIRKRSSDMT
jgi:ABC-type Na+ transport system ATPase subunit NatA